MRFIVDHNVGKLARWLRMMGYDSLFFNGDDDAHMVARALAELGAPVLIVPGNMDPKDFAIPLWEEEGLVVLHRRSHRIRDTGFVGMGGIVARNPSRLGDHNRFYHRDDDVGPALLEAFSDIADCRRKVLLTHQPPQGLLDMMDSGHAFFHVNIFYAEHLFEFGNARLRNCLLYTSDAADE